VALSCMVWVFQIPRPLQMLKHGRHTVSGDANTTCLFFSILPLGMVWEPIGRNNAAYRLKLGKHLPASLDENDCTPFQA